MPNTRSDKGSHCGKCDTFEKNDSWIKCSACPNYLHRKCSKLSDLQFDAIIESLNIEKKTGKRSLIWCCELCDGTVTDVLSNLQKYKKIYFSSRPGRDESSTG